MKTLDKLYKRLRKIGIDVVFVGNYPWIYLDTVNGNRVTEKFMANHVSHGHTCVMGKYVLMLNMPVKTQE